MAVPAVHISSARIQSAAATCSGDDVDGSSETQGSIPRLQRLGATPGACTPVSQGLQRVVAGSESPNALSGVRRCVGAIGDTAVTCHVSAAEAETDQVQTFCWGGPTAQAAVQTLTRALAEDPVNAFLLGGSGSNNAAFVEEEVRGYLKALPDAAHFICTKDHAAVALWQLLPQETPRNELLAGWTRVLRVPLRHWRSLLDLEMHYEGAHSRIAGTRGSYYYLSFIGTLPEVRGKGYGSLLLRTMTRRADAEGRVCMLEATSMRSKELYERHGFEVYETYCVRPKAPPVFLMLREPQPVSLADPAMPKAPAVAADQAVCGQQTVQKPVQPLSCGYHAGVHLAQPVLEAAHASLASAALKSYSHASMPLTSSGSAQTEECGLDGVKQPTNSAYASSLYSLGHKVCQAPAEDGGHDLIGALRNVHDLEHEREWLPPTLARRSR